MFWFELWREFKLSLAEIFWFFPNAKIEYISDKILILEGMSHTEIRDYSSRCGGVIKIFEIEKDFRNYTLSTLQLLAFEEISKTKDSGKIKYGVNFFWANPPNHRAFLPRLKDKFKEASLSSRFLNQDFKNLSSAIILWEKLVKSKSDVNFVFATQRVYFGTTIWVQDINAYSKRDFWKKRDMEIGMLPPKLAQTMINLATGSKRFFQLYDPFCGLWTLLIESILMWNTKVFWSDLNKEMVEATIANIDFTHRSFGTSTEKTSVIFQDARKIQTSPVILENKIDVIVSEWYLWELFTHKDISMDRINLERKKLAELYKDFFEGLRNIKFPGTIVISFPFWELNGKYIYFFEIYDVLKKYCHIQPLLPKNDLAKESMSWSLFYKRNSQIVGREIFKLKIKF